MRTNGFLLGGILLVAFAFFSFLYAAIDPDRGNSIHGIVFFSAPIFPAMMGLVLIVAGYATGLMNRISWNSHQMV
jgi:hypothetical protein